MRVALVCSAHRLPARQRAAPEVIGDSRAVYEVASSFKRFQLTPRAGFEPAAYPLGGDRSIQLSYRGRAQSVDGRVAWANEAGERDSVALWVRDFDGWLAALTP